LNFLLNELVDILEKEAQAAAKTDPETPPPSEKVANGFKNGHGHANGPQKEPLITWVHKNFQVTCFATLILLFFIVVATNLEENINCELCIESSQFVFSF
jgi:hypothetical protein